MTATRRRFLSAATLVGLGVGADRLLRLGGDQPQPDLAAGRASDAVEFHGHHQAGIATPTQEHLQFAAFDLVSGSRDDLRDVLSRWTTAAALLTQGRPIGAVDSGDAAPGDTGESIGLGPASLTVTFGLGPSLFAARDRRNVGLARMRPRPLVALPAFDGENLDPALCDGDLGVQVCANDPQVAFHAMHNLMLIASPAV